MELPPRLFATDAEIVRLGEGLLACALPREADLAAPLHELVNELLATPMGRRDWPLRFYSPELLFPVEARRTLVSPDISALP